MLNITKNIIDKWNIYKRHRKAYALGKRAALGKNIYLTFGSSKTITKNAEDSYNRHAMAMKQYNEELCDKGSFILGYNSIRCPSKVMEEKQI